MDTQAPVISLSGDTEITIEAGSNYEEAGFSAVDNYDGDITDKVETSAEVDTYTKVILQLYIQLKILLVMKHLQNVLYM